MRWLTASLALAFAVGACTFFAEGPPENVCVSDGDCFRAQGEICNTEENRCEPAPDAGVPVNRPGDAGVDVATSGR